MGNGPSVVGSNLAGRIDQFDDVVRFNNFQLKGYESDVGTKCTILARRSCNDVDMHGVDRFHTIYNFVTYCSISTSMRAVSRDVAEFYGDKCSNIDMYQCKKYGEILQLDQPHKERATIGALTICMLMEEYAETYPVIHICGFDFLKTDKKGIVQHYFPKKPIDAKYHNGKKEERYVTQLIQEKRVITI